jgi:hypothetical protein
MPVFLRIRFAAIRLARALRQSILTETTLWDIDFDDVGRPALVAGPFRVVIAPRAIRLFDALHVYCNGAEIWLPLISRLRLRNAVRLVLIENALDLMHTTDLKTGRRSNKVHRKSRQEQPA